MACSDDEPRVAQPTSQLPAKCGPTSVAGQQQHGRILRGAWRSPRAATPRARSAFPPSRPGRRGACHLARHILQAPCRAVRSAVAEMSNVGQLRHAVMSYVSEPGYPWPDSVEWLPTPSPSNTADQLRSGAPVHPGGGGTGRHLSLPFGCRPELRQLHPLVRQPRALRSQPSRHRTARRMNCVPWPVGPQRDDVPHLPPLLSTVAPCRATKRCDRAEAPHPRGLSTPGMDGRPGECTVARWNGRWF